MQGPIIRIRDIPNGGPDPMPLGPIRFKKGNKGFKKPTSDGPSEGD